MFTTNAAKLAAQTQASMFDEPAPAEVFELAAPEADGPAVVKATANGATFIRNGTDWVAVARRRGRPMALASFVSPSREGAAAMFCSYFNLKA